LIASKPAAPERRSSEHWRRKRLTAAIAAAGATIQEPVRDGMPESRGD
jgi:hypothetical protein